MRDIIDTMRYGKTGVFSGIARLACFKLVY
jgi:hypothetical protein